MLYLLGGLFNDYGVDLNICKLDTFPFIYLICTSTDRLTIIKSSKPFAWNRSTTSFPFYPYNWRTSSLILGTILVKRFYTLSHTFTSLTILETCYCHSNCRLTLQCNRVIYSFTTQKRVLRLNSYMPSRFYNWASPIYIHLVHISLNRSNPYTCLNIAMFTLNHQQTDWR